LYLESVVGLFCCFVLCLWGGAWFGYMILCNVIGYYVREYGVGVGNLMVVKILLWVSINE
jgi:hypothetical protein